jgi:hypothetical protein
MIHNIRQGFKSGRRVLKRWVKALQKRVAKKLQFFSITIRINMIISTSNSD